MTMKRRNRRIRIVGYILFLLYLIGLVYFLFFSEGLGRDLSTPYRYNLVPFREICRFLNNREAIGEWAVQLNLLGNVLAFVPFGFFLPLITFHRTNIPTTTLLTAVFSILVECTQLVTKVGSFDVDDLILNTIGGLLGALLYFAGRGIYRWIFRRR